MSGFRAKMAPVHIWGGLVLGWLLYAIVLAGSLSVFRPEIGAWMRPELAGRMIDPNIATLNGLNWLSTNAAHAPAWYVDAASSRAPYVYATWAAPSGFVQHALDPLSGAPGPLRDTLGGEFFYRFHFELQLPYPYGRLIAGAAAMGMVLALLTGVIVHRRIFVDIVRFRPGKGQRSWLDAHNLLGVAGLPFHLVIAFTGAVTLATMLMPWPQQAIYKNAPARFYDDLDPASSAPTASSHAQALAPFGAMLAQAEQRLGADGIAQIYVYAPGDTQAIVLIRGGNGRHIGYATHVLRFSGTTGVLLADRSENRAGAGLFAFLYGLHIARFAPGLTRWLYFGSGVVLACVIASGLRLWTLRKSRSDASLAVAIVGRINIGMICGTPAAFGAYFLANRLIPAAWSARAALEVDALFAVWGLWLVLASALPQRIGWIVCAGGTSVVTIGVCTCCLPLAGAVDAGVATVAILAAAGFAFSAWRAAFR